MRVTVLYIRAFISQSRSARHEVGKYLVSCSVAALRPRTSPSLRLFASTLALQAIFIVRRERRFELPLPRQPMVGSRSLCRSRLLHLQKYAPQLPSSIARYAACASDLHDEEFPTTLTFTVSRILP